MPTNQNLLINELIREYLIFNGYRETLSIFLPGEAGGGVVQDGCAGWWKGTDRPPICVLRMQKLGSHPCGRSTERSW